MQDTRLTVDEKRMTPVERLLYALGQLYVRWWKRGELSSPAGGLRRR